MCKYRSAAVAGIMFLTLIIFTSPQAQCDTVDDDASLEFYWTAATGNVDHYNVYLSTNERDYLPVGTTPIAPTQENPYAVPISAEDGKKYRLKVEAEDASNNTGPMSDPSDLVWCKFRSPGDVSGPTPADADGNLRVGAGDWALLCLSWDGQRGNPPFDYRADFNYDDIVGVLDLSVIGSNWGNVYGGTGAPMRFPSVASSSKCRIRLVGPENIRVGEEVILDIVMEGAKDIYAMEFGISFDPALVKVEGIEKGTFFSTGGTGSQQHRGVEVDSWIAGDISQARGRISPTLAAMIPGSFTGTGGDGVVARLRLTATSDGASTISLDNICAYDSRLNGIPVRTINAALTIWAPEHLLAQNYPNPLNPETWIPYSLAEGCDRVTITIYSAIGQEIRRLELGRKDAGFYTSKDRAAYWDGRNKEGEHVASGIYFYNIRAGEFVQTRKMTVLR